MLEVTETDFPEVKLSQPFVRVVKPTVLKSDTEQSHPGNTLASLKAGFEFNVQGWEKAGNHIKVSLSGEEFSYLFADHIEVVGVKGTPVPVQALVNKGVPLNLPGYDSLFYTGNPIRPGSHFNWGEATRDGQRMPTQKSQVDQIIAVSRNLDDIREILGSRPMRITSWLRPPHINRAVGGVPNSRHISGDGVDFQVVGLHLVTAQNMIRKYCQEHGMGLGLGAPRGFIHVDRGGWRMWNY
jgi:hypothetical protein